MQLGRVRWANAELLARQAKDAMRRLKLTTLKLRLSRVMHTTKMSFSAKAGRSLKLEKILAFSSVLTIPIVHTVSC